MPMRGGSNQLISAEATAELLDVSVDTIYRRWKSWGLKGYRIGRQLKFRVRDIEAFIERQSA